MITTWILITYEVYTSFIGMGESANEGVFDWVFSDPNVIKAASIIGRVLDDMGSHTRYTHGLINIRVN